jgi:hypothetical protein
MPAAMACTRLFRFYAASGLVEDVFTNFCPAKAR